MNEQMNGSIETLLALFTSNTFYATTLTNREKGNSTMSSTKSDKTKTIIFNLNKDYVII